MFISTIYGIKIRRILDDDDGYDHYIFTTMDGLKGYEHLVPRGYFNTLNVISYEDYMCKLIEDKVLPSFYSR